MVSIMGIDRFWNTFKNSIDSLFATRSSWSETTGKYESKFSRIIDAEEQTSYRLRNEDEDSRLTEETLEDDMQASDNDEADEMGRKKSTMQDPELQQSAFHILINKPVSINTPLRKLVGMKLAVHSAKLWAFVREGEKIDWWEAAKVEDRIVMVISDQDKYDKE